MSEMVGLLIVILIIFCCAGFGLLTRIERLEEGVRQINVRIAGINNDKKKGE